MGGRHAPALAWPAFVERRRLLLHPRKTMILPCAEPATFCGVVLAPGSRRLPEANVTRFRNRMRGMADRLRHGTIEPDVVERCAQAWQAHAAHAGGKRLARAVLRASPILTAGGKVRL